jgi:hypothetical protein
MKINGYKVYHALRWRDKLPRKIKKAILGKRMKRSKLKKLLKSVTVSDIAQTMYGRPNIHPHAFCPKCGNEGYVGTGNMTTYPEHWEDFHCTRCYSVVATIDNSPFHHVLEDIQ